MIYRKDKKEFGLCWDCSSPSVIGKSRCDIHLKGNSKANSWSNIKDRGTLDTENRKAYGRKYSRKNRRGNGRFKYIYGHAIKKGKTFTLTEIEWRELISLPCYYCEMPNNSECGIGLDRLDNTKGYNISNVVSCCIECNYVRGDRFNPQEMKKLGKVIKDIKLSRE